MSPKLCYKLLNAGYDVKLFWIFSSFEKIIQRNREKGNEQTASHFRNEVIKARNLFWKFDAFFDGVIVDTEDITEPCEWESLSILSSDIMVRKCDDDYIRYFTDYVISLPAGKMHESEEFSECFLNVVSNPSFVYVDEKKGFVSVLTKLHAVPMVISERWKKYA